MAVATGARGHGRRRDRHAGGERDGESKPAPLHGSRLARAGARANLLLVKRLGVVAVAVLALALLGGRSAPAEGLQADCNLFTSTATWLGFAGGLGAVLDVFWG